MHKGRRRKPFARLDRYKPTTFRWWVVDIIEYPEETVFLLDIIQNQESFSNLPYSDVVLLGRRFGIPVKSVAAVLSDTKELLAFYDEVRCNDCLFQGRHIEGFVLQDVTGYMFKIKLPYYKFWKTMRSVSEEIRNKGHSKREAIFTTKEEKDIYGFLLNNIIPGSEHKINIIQLRNQFYAGQDK